MTHYELHPLCTLFPRLTGAEFTALRDDIKANGLRQPIVLHDGMILDGGNRYRACIEAGITPTFAEFRGGNLVSFVLSANLHRRHMSAGQQAAIVASAQDWAKAQPEGRPQKQCNVAPLSTAESRAAESGASLRTQKMADKVAKADPALAVKVAHGEVTLPKAHAQVSHKPTLKQTLKGVEPEQPAGDATEDDAPDLDELIDEVQRENKVLQAQVEAMSASDLPAKLASYVRMYEDAVRKQSEEMDKTKRATDREAWTKKQLMRCGKAVGEEDPTRIAAAVEAMARAAKKVEA